MQEKLDCIRRELKFRRYVYPRRVAADKMTQAQATREIEIMEAVEADYDAAAQTERLI